MESHFLNKRCKLVKSDGFVLYGIPREITPMFVLFETQQRTSMLTYLEIRELCLDPMYQHQEQ